MQILVSTLIAFLLSALLVPGVIRLADSKGWHDPVDSRKLHTIPTPRLGGIAIFWAFTLTVGLAYLVGWYAAPNGLGIRHVWMILVSALAAHVLGLLDDFTDLRARYKFLVQLAIAIGLISMGFHFRVIMVPWGSGAIDLGLFGPPLTLFWVVGVMNAVNLIDGMDGLAGGLSVIAAAIFGSFFLARGNGAAALICFSLGGALVGFLLFNLPFPRARIFMGDSGSLFLGLILAILPLLGPAQGIVEIGIMSAITILLIPIYDTIFAMMRRARAGVSFFTPDKLHVHHRLLDQGLSPLNALLRIYAAALLLGLVAISTLFVRPTVAFAMKIAVWIFFAIFFARISSRPHPAAKGKAEIKLEDSGDKSQHTGTTFVAPPRADEEAGKVHGQAYR